MVLGTPSYMSPEQLAGKKIDGRSDLFSLGVTLYQMTCGQLPFVGESLAQLMYKITNEAPTEILSFDPALPSCVVAVIDRALNKNVAERYQRGAEMAADLRACIDQLAAQAA
jgi:serine/threonine-protein kinase